MLAMAQLTDSAVPTGAWDAIGAPLGAGAGTGGVARLGDKLHKLAARLQTVRTIDDLYLSLVSEWRDPAAVVLGEGGQVVREPVSLLDDPLPARGADQEQLRMMFRDSMTYLPDDILCKVDRAAMAIGNPGRARTPAISPPSFSCISQVFCASRKLSPSCGRSAIN